MKCFYKLAMVYIFDKTKPLFGLNDTEPVFNVTGEFSLKIVVCVFFVFFFMFYLENQSGTKGEGWPTTN